MSNQTTQRSNCWSITINNPTPDDFEQIHLAQQRGWVLLGQLEKGEVNGVTHIQAMLKTPQVRFSAVKKAFPRAHIEVARNPDALREYVTKEETKVGELPENINKALYPSIEELYRRYTNYLYSLSGHNDTVDQYRNSLEGQIERHKYWMEEKGMELEDAIHEILQEIILPTTGLRVQSWKSFLSTQIMAGNHIDQLATNPQIISMIKEYTDSILFRAIRQLLEMKTDGDNA